MQAGLGIGRVRLKDFKFGGRAKLDDAFVSPAQGDAAPGTGAQAVAGMQQLIGPRKHPGSGTAGRDFDVIFGFDDENIVGAGRLRDGLGEGRWADAN